MLSNTKSSQVSLKTRKRRRDTTSTGPIVDRDGDSCFKCSNAAIPIEGRRVESLESFQSAKCWSSPTPLATNLVNQNGQPSVHYSASLIMEQLLSILLQQQQQQQQSAPQQSAILQRAHRQQAEIVQGQSLQCTLDALSISQKTAHPRRQRYELSSPQQEEPNQSTTVLSSPAVTGVLMFLQLALGAVQLLQQHAAQHADQVLDPRKINSDGESENGRFESTTHQASFSTFQGSGDDTEATALAKAAPLCGISPAVTDAKQTVPLSSSQRVQGQPPGLAITSKASIDSAQVSSRLLEHQEPILIYTVKDEASLSGYQCNMRQHMEYFSATADDTVTKGQGRIRPVQLGQVGVRCRHCRHLPQLARTKGAVYFPTRLSNIYQAGQNMACLHLLDNCPNIGENLRAALRAAAVAPKSKAGGGRKYWAASAQTFGIVEDEESLGLFFMP